MKKTYLFFALLACASKIFGQSVTWDVAKDGDDAVVYDQGIVVSFTNIGDNEIKLDKRGSESPKLCLKDGKLDIKLEGENLFFGSCNPKESLNKVGQVQLISTSGKKFTISIKFPSGGSGGDSNNILEDVYRAFYDAKSLRSGNPDDIKKIREKYNIAVDNKNPFLAGINKNAMVSGIAPNFKLLGSAIGGLDVTKFADGLAKFLVKRAKEELTIAFFEDFKKELDNQEDIKDLFPRTKATLDLVDKEIYNYERYLVTLREDFQNDFEALPDNITEIVENHKTYFDVHTELKSGVLLSSKIAVGLRDKDHPGDIISSLDKSDINGFNSKAQQSFFIVQTFSEALRDNTTGENANYWISKVQFQQMTKDRKWFEYFVGLSLEMIKQKDVNLYETLIKNTTIEPFTATINSIITQSHRINVLIANHKSDQKVGLETIASYVDAVSGLFEAVSDAVVLLTPNTAESEFLKNKFIPFIKSSNSLVGNISNQKYGSALFNTIELYKLTITKGAPNSPDEVVLAWLTKYGGFMAAMISAENSDEVAAVIETYALPSGSARIKRESYFNIAVNSYLGLYAGIGRSEFGVSAPVGVSFSWGTKNGGSFSIFPTLIDIGAVTAFRFKDDTSQVAKVFLREIFSPGLFISFGFRKLPVSLNLGGQFAPLLKRVVAGTNDYNIERNLRWSISFLVDIPLLNLYNRANKKPKVIKVP